LKEPHLALDKQKKELVLLKQTIAELKDEERNKKDLLDTLSKRTKEIQIEHQKLSEEKTSLARDKLAPYKNKDGVLVHLNDDGYEVFHDTGLLFHIWKYKKHFGLIPPGYEIHHKDGNKRNNDLDNLECLPKEEHKKRHS